MSTPPGLELLIQLIEDHRTDHGGKAQVVPCLHEELDEDVQLLHAGAHRLGGTFYDLSRPEKDWESPAGPLCTDRLQLVEGMLEDAGPLLPAKVVIELDADQRVVARFNGYHNPLEPSLWAILHAAEVVASSAYDEFELILLAAALAPIDTQRRQLLWSLLTINPIDLGVADTGTTIVPILGAGLDPEPDYLRRPELKYVVRSDRMLRRRTGEARRRDIASICATPDEPLVLFLGAGASASSKIPLGNHYRDLALANLLGPDYDEDTPGEAFFDLLHERRHLLDTDSTSRKEFATALTLERVLLETFNELGFRSRSDAPVIREIIKDCANALDYDKPGRKALRELVKLLPGRVIIMTVNFDQLIEDKLGADHTVFFRPEDYRDEARIADLVAYVAGDADKPVPILKLHGSITDPESLIATINTTSAGFHDDVLATLNRILEVVSGPLRWVWIGCSMRDRDMNRWLNGLSPKALDEWWVDPMPGQSLDDFFIEQRAPRWGPKGMSLSDRLIIDSADAFLRDLAKIVAIS